MVALSFDDLVAAVRSAAPDQDALARLGAAAALSATIADTADALLTHFVDECRRLGHSWSEIGAALGVSKQAVQQRFVESSLGRLTPRTRHVVEVGRQVADDQGAAALRLDHLALALFSEPTAIGTKVLTDVGVTRDGLDAAIARRSRAAGARLSDAPPMGQAVLATALDMGHNYIGTEHIVLACLRDPSSLIARALKDVGATDAKVRPAILAALRTG